MKKNHASEIIPEEALDQRVIYTLDRKLQAARNAQKIADQRLRAVFDELDKLYIEPGEIPTEAENATTLEEAIACYVQYNEYTRSGLLREIKAAYASVEKGARQ